MYRETRIPRLRASLWISVPDKAHSLAEAAHPDGGPAFVPKFRPSPDYPTAAQMPRARLLGRRQVAIRS